MVIPLTSVYTDKLVDKFDVLVSKDEDNKLYQDSSARIRQMRPASYNRIGEHLGTIVSETVKGEINQTIQKMLFG